MFETQVSNDFPTPLQPVWPLEGRHLRRGGEHEVNQIEAQQNLLHGRCMDRNLDLHSDEAPADSDITGVHQGIEQKTPHPRLESSHHTVGAVQSGMAPPCHRGFELLATSGLTEL